MRHGAIPYTLLASLGILIGTVVLLGLMYMTYSNAEVRLRNQIVAKQKANTAEFDNMFKKISQVAQVTDAQKTALKEIFIGYAQARTGGGDAKPVMNWIKEAIPNVDTSTFNNLQNIITGSRDSWTARQTELVDMSREHENCLTTMPSSWFCGSRPHIEITLVTSSRTEHAFATGKDDDTDVFSKPAKAEKP